MRQTNVDKYLADLERRKQNSDTGEAGAKKQVTTRRVAVDRYMSALDDAIAASPTRQQRIAQERAAEEAERRKKAQLEANIAAAQRDRAIGSIESQALEAIKQRLGQGMGEFQATDRAQANPFSGQQDVVKLALNLQQSKEFPYFGSWRTEALELGQQAVENKRQEYAQAGSVDEYAKRYQQVQGVYPDESERTERADLYAQEVPYLSDFETLSQQQSEDTKRKRTEEEKKKYEMQKAWAETGGASIGHSLANQEQDVIDDYVSDDQLAVYNYLVNSGQREYADQYWQQVMASAQARRNQDQVSRAREVVEMAPEGFVRDALGSAISVGSNIANAIQGSTYIAGEEIRELLTGQPAEIDPQNLAFTQGRVRDALRQDVSEGMPGWGKFLYDTGMSISDSTAQALLFGPTGGALVLGSGAAVDTVRDVKERGGSDQQALGLGLIAGGAELLTEKLGFERLGKLIGGNKDKVAREIAGHIIKEGGEEGATEVINILADVLVMADKSEYSAAVAGYMSQGMSEKDAHIQAILDAAGQVGLAWLGGAISGGVTGGGAATVGAVKTRITQDRNSRLNALNYGARGEYVEYDPARVRAEQIATVRPDEQMVEAQMAATIPTIERMAQEYGEDASVFKSHYEGGDPAQYKRGFDAMFNAGKSGLDMKLLGGVSDQLTKGMSETTKQSIYTAGRNRAANTITPGVVNLTTKKLNSSQRMFTRVWDAIGKEYGLEIDVVDSIGGANGAYSGGRRIVVAMDAADGAYIHVAGHEAVHYIKSTDPDAYAVLEESVLKYLTDNDATFDLEYAIKERIEQYQSAGIKNVDRAYALEEIVAETIPTFFSNETAMREFVRDNRTLAEKIRDFLVDFVNKVREITERYMVSQDRAEIAEVINNTEALREFAQTFDMALRSAQKMTATATGEVRVSQNESERNRALKPGEMKNEFYGALGKQEWHEYFQRLWKPEFDADSFDDGQQTHMIVNDKLLLMEMQRNGEFSVVDVYRSADGWYNEGIEYLLENWRLGRYVRENVKTWLATFEADDGSGVFERYDRHSGRFVRLDGKEDGAGRGAAGVSGGRDAHGAGVREDAVGQDQGDGTVTDAGLGTSDDGEVAYPADQDVLYSLRTLPETDYVKERDKAAIKKDDVDRLRSIGQKSIANFTSEEIRATHVWAEKFYEELGAKSPYFRAWFGDWRENDTSAVTISKLQVDDEIPKGRYTNVDTGWDVAVSSVGINDTVAHSSKGNVSVHALYGVDDLIVNAILLDTEASVPRGKKKENTAFMHKMYAPFVLDDKAYIAKLTVEEIWDNRSDTLKRLYNLRAIETAPADAYSGFTGKTDHSTTSTETVKYSVADLFADVKKADEDFSYAGKSSAIVNADGTPKVMYHGSQASFTAFDKKKARSSGLYGRGFYFTDSDTHAGQYGSLYQVYLKVENPLTPDGSTVTKAQVKKFLEAVAENEDDYSIENYGTYDVDEITKKVYKKDAFAVIQDINATAIGDMVEAVKLFNEVNGTEFDGIVVPTETVVFEPTQIKSATDNVGTFDPEDPDIRFSLRNDAGTENAPEADQNMRLPADVNVDSESIRQQAVTAMQVGLRAKLDQQIKSVAARILKDTGSSFERDGLIGELKALVNEYAKHGFSEDSVQAVNELAQEIIGKSTKLDKSLQEQYAGLKARLTGKSIRLTDVQKQEVASQYGSYGEFRRMVSGVVNLSDNGTMSLDAAWEELSGQHPEIFPPDTREGDMPGALMDFRTMMQPRYENRFGEDAETAVADLALRIQGDVMGMIGAKNAAQQLYGSAQRMREQFRKEYDAELREQQKARVAEFQRIAGELRAAKERGDKDAQKKIMGRYRTALGKVDAERAIAEVRAANKLRNEQMAERREAARIRERVLKHANDLQRMLRGEEKGKRVPTKLQGLVIDVLEALDVNGKKAAESGRETKRAAAFREKLAGIRTFYEGVWNSQSNGESPEGLDGLMMTLSERNVAEMTEALEVLGSGEAFYLRDMDSAQLKSLDALLKNVKHTVESIGKLWRSKRYESVIEMGNESIREMGERPAQKITKSNAAGLRDFFALDLMEPVSYGERLGNVGRTIIQNLLDGQKIRFGLIRDASKATRSMLDDTGVTGYDIGKWNKNVQDVNLSSGMLKMTDTQLMSLYLTAKRPQGKQHLLGNGMRLPTTDQTGAQVKTIQLTEGDIAYMTGLLSEKQRMLADRMGAYLSTAVAKWGNDVTQRMYLYDAFTDKNYWPITSDPNVLKTQEPEGDRAFLAIVNAGFTKPLNAKATNAVIIQDAFAVFDQHISEMASYAAFAEVMTDTMAWLNYRQRYEDGSIGGNVKESMERVLGKGGIKYLTDLIQDINGARKGGDNVQLSKWLGNYKKAAVMGKIRVAIQQPTSIVRAAAEMNPAYLIAGLHAPKGSMEEMHKWSTLAWWKSNGNYEIGIGKGIDEVLWGKHSRRDAAMDAITTQGGLIDPGKMDDWAWARIWSAVKREVARKNKNLEAGSDEFMRAVAERFDEIIDRTQVVDTVMHRSALMRSKDGLAKNLTSFMGEPIKSVNMLMRAVMEAGRHPKSAAAHKKLARSVAAYTASAAATAAATALVDAIRFRDDDEETLDYLFKGEFGKDWAEQWLRGFVSNVNPLSNIPFVQDVYDMAVNGGEAPTIMAFEGITDLVSAADTVYNYLNGNNSRKSTVYGVIKPVLTAASSLLGLPMTGIMANIETVGRLFDPEWAQTKSEYATSTQAYGRLYEAILDGDNKKVLAIRTELAKGLYGAQPKTPKEIDTGIARQLALNDERIMQYWQMRESGDQYREMVALRKEIQKDGFTEEHVVQAGNQAESILNGQYNDLLEEGKTGDAEELAAYAAKYGMTLEQDAEKDMTEELDPKMFQRDHLYSAIRNGDLDDIEGITEIMEMESEAENPEEAIRNQVSGEFREEYIAAARGGSTAKVRDLDKKLDYFGIDAEDRAAWIKKDRYEDLGEALEAGKTGKADEYVEQLRESGVSDDDIASSVSSRFKETYIDLVVKGKDDEAEELAEMLRDLGLVTPKGKNKYRQDVLDDWVEAWYKAQEEKD